MQAIEEKKIAVAMIIDVVSTGGTQQSGTSGLNIPDAVAYLDSNALTGSSGACAKYVRLAIQAGGVTLTRAGTAAEYGPSLTAAGYIIVPQAGYVPKAGDVIVIQPYADDSAGHMTMYDGYQWVSDFKQRDFWGDSRSRNANPPPSYTIYRP